MGAVSYQGNQLTGGPYAKLLKQQRPMPILDSNFSGQEEDFQLIAEPGIATSSPHSATSWDRSAVLKREITFGDADNSMRAVFAFLRS